MRVIFVLFFALLLVGCGGGASSPPAMPVLAASLATQYVNPVRITVPAGGIVESCPDPSVIRGQTSGDDNWYLYCTNDQFTDGSKVHYIAVSVSKDLVNWTYVGDVFQRKPSWVTSGGWLWAPDIQFFNRKYYLYYTVSDTTYGMGGSAIFVATSDSPIGPWRASSTPVVEPSSSPCCGGVRNWTIDSNIVEEGGQRYIFYGTIWSGVYARMLSPDGMTSYASGQLKIAESDRYEASYVIKRNGYFYLFVSAGSCCNGPLSGYGVFVARSTSALGPYIDRDGHTLLEARVGGTNVLAMNGNRWIGPGHNSVATDATGQDWMIYHAIDANKPYFAGSWTRRPVMLDRIDWIDGWPRLRGGAGPSHSPEAAPVMMHGQQNGGSIQLAQQEDRPGTLLANASDEFDTGVLGRQWSWIRPPAALKYGLENGSLRFDTQSGYLYVNRADASILTEQAPASDYMVEVKLSTNVPRSGSHNFAQAGLVIYKDDANYLKLVDVAINNTRQIEFGKQMTATAPNPAYGSAFLGSPEDATYLRLVKRTTSGVETYTSYSSHDGINWERGAAWNHTLGQSAKIGLVSMAGAGFSAYFDYVRVYSLAN